MKAIEEYETGSNLLQNYKKKSVDTESDCDYLKPAFENYVNGHMHENSLFGNIISKDTSNLVDQYLKLKPNDVIIEYLKVLFVVTSSPSDHEKLLFSDYERNKLAIRTGEIFATKLKSSKIRTSKRKKVLSELYYYLESRYVASDQPERELDSFLEVLTTVPFMVLHTATEKLNRKNQKHLFISFSRWHQAAISSFRMHITC